MNCNTKNSLRSAAALSVFLTALAILAVLAFPAQAQVKLEQLSKDTFTNSEMQHATEVEPDTYSFGSTFVTAFQVGRRYSGGGASDLGFAISTDGGSSWKHGYLPGLTQYYKGGQFNAVSDASVVYDAHHGVWLVASLGIDDTKDDTVLLVSSSPDGINWNKPVVANDNSSYADKDWITCDNTSTSKYYGNCYIEWEDAGIGDQVMMTTSTDGGQTWSAKYPISNAIGLGGQPVVQTDGNVVVPFFADESNAIGFFTSSNGGKSWSSAGTISSISDHQIAGGLRAVYDMPSAEVGSDGTVYVVWWDCRFRSNCSSNDIVLSTSTDGKTWSSPSRIPIDPVKSTVDHFLPGIAVDQSTSGNTTHLGLTYYYYPNANCTVASCRLAAGFVYSHDAGASWSTPSKLASGMQMSWLPNTTLGYMVGDYISASYLNGKAFGVFAKALAPAGSKFREAMYTPEAGLYEIEEGNGPYLSSAGEQPVPNAKSDHPPVPFWDTEGRRPKQSGVKPSGERD
jgi:hypothetical protein